MFGLWLSLNVGDVLAGIKEFRRRPIGRTSAANDHHTVAGKIFRFVVVMRDKGKIGTRRLEFSEDASLAGCVDEVFTRIGSSFSSFDLSG